jgi:hypothetical protein
METPNGARRVPPFSSGSNDGGWNGKVVRSVYVFSPRLLALRKLSSTI